MSTDPEKAAPVLQGVVCTADDISAIHPSNSESGCTEDCVETVHLSTIHYNTYMHGLQKDKDLFLNDNQCECDLVHSDV